MLYFRPIRLEIEVRTVIEVVALHAHLHDFAEHLAVLVALIFDDRESQGRPQLFDLVFSPISQKTILRLLVSRWSKSKAALIRFLTWEA